MTVEKSFNIHTRHTVVKKQTQFLSPWTLVSLMFGFLTWTVARQVPLSMEFLRQEYWSG